MSYNKARNPTLAKHKKKRKSRVKKTSKRGDRSYNFSEVKRTYKKKEKRKGRK